MTLVVPCYNEESRLPVEAFRRFLMAEPDVLLLFVNDGSRDGTLRVLNSIAAESAGRASVLDLPRNAGKAEAVRQGMKVSFSPGTDLVGFWDADLATPLTELSAFVDVLRSRPEIEMVFAARVRLLGRSISRNPRRHYVGRVGATLISSSLGLAVYDTQCGAKVFRNTEAIAGLFEQPFLSRWIFDVEIIARLVRQRGRDAAARAIFELPIRTWQDVEGSKVRSTDFLHALADLWRIHRAYRR